MVSPRITNIFTFRGILTTSSIPVRQTAAEMYSSQTNMNFENAAKMYSSQIKEGLDSKEAMYKMMSDYTQSIHSEKTEHVERYWIPGKASGTR